VTARSEGSKGIRFAGPDQFSDRDLRVTYLFQAARRRA
jgi:hypothetical protein